MGSRHDDVAAVAARWGAGIRAARLARGLTQTQLGGLAGVTRKTLYTLERGGLGATLGTLLQVLEALALLERAATLSDRWDDPIEYRSREASGVAATSVGPEGPAGCESSAPTRPAGQALPAGLCAHDASSRASV